MFPSIYTINNISIVNLMTKDIVFPEECEL